MNMTDLTEIRDYVGVLREIKDTLEIISFDSFELKELCES